MHKITVYSSNHKKTLVFPLSQHNWKCELMTCSPTFLTEKSKSYFLPLSWVSSSHSRVNKITKPHDLLPNSSRAASVARALIKTCCRKKVFLLLPCTQSSGTNVPTAPGKCGGFLPNREQYFFLAPVKFSRCFRSYLRNDDALLAQGLQLRQTPAGLMQE